MKVVILCGGKGTRMREETEYRPKPLVSIGSRPIIWHIMKIFTFYGFREFVLCLGYRGDMIKSYFLDYEALNNDFKISIGKSTSITYDSHTKENIEVTLADTGMETMTGGRVKRVEKYLPDTFIATYGDGVADINIRSLVDFHKKHGKLATVTAVRPISRFGVFNMDASGRVIDFAEKPQVERWVNAGFMVFDKKVLSYLGGDESILEREPLERLTNEGQLMAFCHDGFFYAMDTYREYLHLNELWASGKAPWKVWN